MSLSEESLIPTEALSGGEKKGGNASWHTKSMNQSGHSSSQSERSFSSASTLHMPVHPVGDAKQDSEDLVDDWSDDEYDDDDEESDAGSDFEL